MKTINNFFYFILFAFVIIINENCYADKLSNPETVADKDDNVYNTLKIGTQTWMVENLKTTKYNDGTAIPLVTDNEAWTALTTPGYCWYNNDSKSYKNDYGALYNWFTVNTGKLAPIGWHVPSDAEWTILENYLSSILGTPDSLAKALSATTNWITYKSPYSIGNDLSKNNKSGFSALPGGCREVSNSAFINFSYGGYWWSSTEDGVDFVWNRALKYHSSEFIKRYDPKFTGLSVRCIKNSQ